MIYRQHTLEKPTTASSSDAPLLTEDGLCGVVLLGGGVRPTPLTNATGRHTLDLPVEPNIRLIDLWLEEAQRLAARIEQAQLSVRVLGSPGALPPPGTNERERLQVEYCEDANRYRGTAGALRDAARDCSDDSYLLVVNSGQMILESLSDIVIDLAATEADVAIVSQFDGSPGGVMLMKSKTLRNVSEIGYVDLKEQALPRISTQHVVRVVHREHRVCLPIRTMDEYVESLRVYWRGPSPTDDDPFAEDWRPSFSVAEEGAEIAPSARVHDSVVLRGGRVGAGALLFGSVVTSGASVLAGGRVVDRLVR